MAITVHTDVPTQLTTVKRKSRTTLETPYQDNYNMVVYYETLVTDASGNTVSRMPADKFVVSFDQIKDVNFILAGGAFQVTGTQVREFISAFVDYLYQNPIAPGTTSVTIPT